HPLLGDVAPPIDGSKEGSRLPSTANGAQVRSHVPLGLGVSGQIMAPATLFVESEPKPVFLAEKVVHCETDHGPDTSEREQHGRDQRPIPKAPVRICLDGI